MVPLAATLLARAPRVSVSSTREHERAREGTSGRAVIWADARGFVARDFARDLVELVHDDGVADVCAGVASTPIAAELAAVRGTPGVNVVEPGTDSSYVGLFPVDVLDLPARVGPLLFGIGVKTCAELALLTRESVEVRLGAETVPFWRLARADDTRCDTLFAPMPRELPHATLDWTDYDVTDPARLLFVINALLESVCDALAEDGRGAREMVLDFMLSDRTTHQQMLRAARATSNRQAWIRLVRSALERMALQSPVTGIAVRATRVIGSEAPQADLFDRGLASAAATESAVARLVEDQGDIVMQPRNSGHPLLEARTQWQVAESPVTRYPSAHPSPVTRHNPAHLTLQLAPIPQAITVETFVRRDHFAPVRYRDAVGWHEVVHVAGPDRVSGGKWNGATAYAREYFRCVTKEGALVWLFRDARDVHKRNIWYLHGWWD